MEKDYFKDRDIEATILSKIHIGDRVLICEKHAQKYAKTIDDLTLGIIVEILTKHNHPRGIKVKVRTIEDEIRVGRIVYLLD